MSEETDAEIAIWNRACLVDEFTPTFPGDVALRRAISFHGIACNGGVTHSLQFHVKELPDIFDAFRFIGASELPGLLTSFSEQYASASQEERSKSERSFDQQYAAAISDRQLNDLFLATYRSNPAAFAPA